VFVELSAVFASGLPSSFVTFLPAVLMVGVFYLLLFRPNQRKQKQWQEMLNNLKIGDKITTTGGMRGTIVALREDTGQVDPVGLFDLDRNIRSVGKAYKKLISDWKEVLPTQSVCLQVPIVLPNEYDDGWAKRLRTAHEHKNGLPTAPANADLEGRQQ